MNISIKWLSEYLSEPINPNKKELKDYCDKMTFSGSKVENFEILFEELENIVIGKLLSVEKHPNADKLFICSVEVGGSEPIQIVTGAINVKAGDIVPAALSDSVIYGGKKITKGKLRGVESQGMLCSLEELGLGLHDFSYAEEDGILVLQGEDLKDLELGQNVKSALLLEDAAVEFEITPNRPDCLSVIGLARESAAALGCGLKLSVPDIKNEDKNDDIKNYLSVSVQNYNLCPRYTAKIIKNVKIEQSPLWLRAKLRACGVRPINNIVDITNYVMLEYGQPMHAFDYNYLNGSKIIVRSAQNGEKITTLDSQKRGLESDMLVIADETAPVALAGVMGGENSEIKADTHTIVFESANFEKMSVRKTSRKLGLRTESSSKFEKGIDAHLTKPAVLRACELVELLGCGTVVSGIIDEYTNLSETVKIKFDPDRINNLLGMSLDRGSMIKILEKLDFKITGDTIEAPSYRTNDILSDSADLAEEISRIYGYGELAPSYKIKRGGKNKYQKFIMNIHETLISGGFNETYTYSFISPKQISKLNLPEGSSLYNYIGLINPISEELSVMRTSLLPSMLTTIALNRSQRNESAYFYDLAKVYFANSKNFGKKIKGESAATEQNTLSIGFYDKAADFYTLKGAVENILKTAGVKYKLSALTGGHELAAAFHPGRSAVIISENGERVYGIFGEVHPIVLENFGIDTSSCAAEINIDILYEDSSGEKRFKPLPKYPAVTRDLALVCDKDLESAAIYEIIERKSGRIFESAEVFDVYKGDIIGKDKKSVAFALTYRDPERTLSDEEVNGVIKKVLAELEKIDVELRK
ncbi:MAG: phenylalanine--tRNA ligase subunit beta [Oscillospiraceae bacterium]|nr:phenylalanine--tRNA ligase subunit beta [Oscillospiraceae bacterium]